MLMRIMVLAGFWAGLQNALDGGGSFVTLPVLMLSGMSPLAANITSTVALFPGQVTSGLGGRRLVTGAGRLPFWALFVISIVGGACGALLLLSTPSTVFTALVPWLVLFATAVFTWGSFWSKPGQLGTHLGPLRNAGATKNALAGVMNASAVLLFVTSDQMHWGAAVALGAGAIVGGQCGNWALHKVNEKILRMVVVGIGACLTVDLFLKPI